MEVQKPKDFVTLSEYEIDKLNNTYKLAQEQGVPINSILGPHTIDGENVLLCAIVDPDGNHELYYGINELTKHLGKESENPTSPAIEKDPSSLADEMINYLGI